MKKLVYLIIFFLYSTVMNAQLKDLVQYVNTLQGTDSNFGLSYGNTYPGNVDLEESKSDIAQSC